jgi:hypothetical protein
MDVYDLTRPKLPPNDVTHLSTPSGDGQNSGLDLAEALNVLRRAAYAYGAPGYYDSYYGKYDSDHVHSRPHHDGFLYAIWESLRRKLARSGRDDSF